MLFCFLLRCKLDWQFCKTYHIETMMKLQPVVQEHWKAFFSIMLFLFAGLSIAAKVGWSEDGPPACYLVIGV